MNFLKIFSRPDSLKIRAEQWIAEAELELAVKQAALEDNYGLGAWPTWNCDLTQGRLIFSDEHGPRVEADVQIAGTVGRADWRWAWANSNLPVAYTRESQAMRSFGLQNKIAEFTEEVVKADNLESLGWRLTSSLVRLSNAYGAYKAPSRSGAVFLVIMSINLVVAA